MATGREKSEWERTSLLAMLSANPNRDPDKRSEPYSPLDFNPFANGRRPEKAEKPKRKVSLMSMRKGIEEAMGIK
jgi:hypothetical protein